jgi:hypothetical protein
MNTILKILAVPLFVAAIMTHYSGRSRLAFGLLMASVMCATYSIY